MALYCLPECLLGLVLDCYAALTKMVASHHCTRVDTLELKDLIYQNIGRQRADTYFTQLNRFLNLKLSKTDFNRSCIEIIGRENISLHNRLIRSILLNASQAKVPPNRARKTEGLGIKVSNSYQKNNVQSLQSDAFLPSPRKCRSLVNRDRKLSPLGPLGKSPSTTVEETVSRNEEQSAAEMHFLSRIRRGGEEEDGEEVEQLAGVSGVRRWSSITAPLGVSYKMGGASKNALLHSDYSDHSFAETCENSGELPDTGSLRSRLEKKLASEGVGISSDGANVLNHGLDVFLKRLIRRCMVVAGSRHVDPLNVGRHSNSQVMSKYGNLHGKHAETATGPTCARMLDFRVAMEADPSILGEDWPVQLEKICSYDLE